MFNFITFYTNSLYFRPKSCYITNQTQDIIRHFTQGILLMKLPHFTYSFNDLKLKHRLILIIIVVAATITGFTLFGFYYVIHQYN